MPTYVRVKHVWIIWAKTKLFSPELHTYISVISSTYVHKQICSKVPILLYFVGPKRPSGNCYISCFLTDKTALSKIIFWCRNSNMCQSREHYTIKNKPKIASNDFSSSKLFWQNSRDTHTVEAYIVVYYNKVGKRS